MKLPRFSLRELFLLVVIAAMGCGWWVEYWRRPSPEIEYRAFGFEIAAHELKRKTGEVITATREGVEVRSASGVVTKYVLADD